jgi:hypothetical protein
VVIEKAGEFPVLGAPGQSTAKLNNSAVTPDYKNLVGAYVRHWLKIKTWHAEA